MKHTLKRKTILTVKHGGRSVTHWGCLVSSSFGNLQDELIYFLGNIGKNLMVSVLKHKLEWTFEKGE